MNSVDIPPVRNESIRGYVYLNVAVRLEKEGRPGLAKLYLQRAIAEERAAINRKKGRGHDR